MDVYFLALTYLQALVVLVCLIASFGANAEKGLGSASTWTARIILASFLVSFAKWWGLW
jgi:hypothetical protein